MVQLEKWRTFNSYADFIEEVELYEKKTCTKFVKRGAKTVAAKKNKEPRPGKAKYSANVSIQVSDSTANTQITQIRQEMASAPNQR